MDDDKKDLFSLCFLKDSEDAGEGVDNPSSRLRKLKKLLDYEQRSFDLFCGKVESEKKRLKQLESWLAKRQQEKGNPSRLKAKIKKQKELIQYFEFLLKGQQKNLERDREEISELSKSIKD